MSESEMQAELERLRAEEQDKGGLTLKVSEKGGVLSALRPGDRHCGER
jgi:hypothetical protein